MSSATCPYNELTLGYAYTAVIFACAMWDTLGHLVRQLAILSGRRTKFLAALTLITFFRVLYLIFQLTSSMNAIFVPQVPSLYSQRPQVVLFSLCILSGSGLLLYLDRKLKADSPRRLWDYLLLVIHAITCIFSLVSSTVLLMLVDSGNFGLLPALQQSSVGFYVSFQIAYSLGVVSIFVTIFQTLDGRAKKENRTLMALVRQHVGQLSHVALLAIYVVLAAASAITYYVINMLNVPALSSVNVVRLMAYGGAQALTIVIGNATSQVLLTDIENLIRSSTAKPMQQVSGASTKKTTA